MRLVAALALSLASFQACATCADSDVNVDMRRLLGSTENLCQAYGGKVMLIVNTASMCGFTPQYEGLQKLYQDRKDSGLVVLGFPSPDFSHQEYDDEKQTAKFCKANYGVTFPMFGITDVKGDGANPLFKKLIEKTGAEPSWNFNKYLVGRDGKTIAHFDSKVTPDSAELAKAIDAALAQKAPGS